MKATASEDGAYAVKNEVSRGITTQLPPFNVYTCGSGGNADGGTHGDDEHKA